MRGKYTPLSEVGGRRLYAIEAEMVRHQGIREPHAVARMLCGSRMLHQGEPSELHMRDGPRKRLALKRACPWSPTGARAESRLAPKTERAGDRPTEAFRVMMVRVQMVARRPTADGGACWLQSPWLRGH